LPTFLAKLSQREDNCRQSLNWDFIKIIMEKGMKRLSLVIAAGFVGLLLSACGENAPKQPEAKTEVVVVQPVAEPAAEPATTDAPATTETGAADAQTQE
jgi:hypothetical protein